MQSQSDLRHLQTHHIRWLARASLAAPQQSPPLRSSGASRARLGAVCPRAPPPSRHACRPAAPPTREHPGRPRGWMPLLAKIRAEAAQAAEAVEAGETLVDNCSSLACIALQALTHINCRRGTSVMSPTNANHLRQKKPHRPAASNRGIGHAASIGPRRRRRRRPEAQAGTRDADAGSTGTLRRRDGGQPGAAAAGGGAAAVVLLLLWWWWWWWWWCCAVVWRRRARGAAGQGRGAGRWRGKRWSAGCAGCW